MRIVVKVFWFLGLIFWSFFLFVDSYKLFVLNGLLEVFPFNAAEVTSINVIQDSSHVNIDYVYEVKNRVYKENYRMVNEYYNNCNIDDTIIVMYNNIIPSVSYIEGIPLKNRQVKIGIYTSLFFIVCILLLGKKAMKSRVVRGG
ncbi:hypothetical protein [Plebeiibacterium marinum]|uniref:DUF3592 domain-containing protein n=1 Tax=Plebeiibacterium marinum TaxID=2992111 RepID=A0AAE3SLZ1_9BACT|nr:hypothetical protein [Plebeiobacterium marinum]MCW3808118.1 hypothetical protein [Plebeiobacterium marinum]